MRGEFGLRRFISGSLPFVGMILSILAQVINMIIGKEAMSSGLSQYVLVLYSNALATLVFLLNLLCFHRLEMPQLNFSIVSKIFLLALFGFTAEVLSYAGVSYSSPTPGTATVNLIPALTYILAVILRMEELTWRRWSGIAKSMGTLTAIAGAFVMTFYSGPAIINGPSNSSLSSIQQFFLSSKQNWVLGGCLLFFSSLLMAAWYIQQASILEVYPALKVIIFLNGLFVTIQSAFFSLILDRDLNAWRINDDMGFIAVIYAGLITISFRLYVTSWCIKKTGPFFVAMFKPFAVVFAAVIGVVLFRDVFYLGRYVCRTIFNLIGSFVLIIGFCSVMWGKAQEAKSTNDSESLNHKVPLLPDEIEQA